MLRRLVPICIVGVLQEALWLGMVILGHLRENTGSFLLLYFALFAICVWSFFRISMEGDRAVWVVLTFAFAFRLTVLPAEPDQSEDVFRYVWDARVASAGLDPFKYPPNAPELEHLRDSKIYPMINSKPYVTAYPPVSQALFRVCHFVFGDRVVQMKAVFSLLEFCAVIVSWRLLRGMGRSPQTIYLVAWNPFFIFEFSHSGHSDSGMILLVLLSFLLIQKSKYTPAMISYAGGVLAKLHPALWFPVYFRRAGWKASLAGIAAGLALCLGFFSPATWIGYLNSLRLYFKLFEFNAGIHYLLCYLGRISGSQSWDQRTGPYLAAALAGVVILIAWKFPRRDTRDLIHACFWIATADLCLATTVHPWYLSWAALALPFFPYAFMLYWTGACFLSYAAYQYRPVFEPAWTILTEYLPMYALMAYEIRRGAPLLEPWARRITSDAGESSGREKARLSPQL